MKGHGDYGFSRSVSCFLTASLYHTNTWCMQLARILHAGSIPSELGSMVALETLHLSYNELSGKYGTDPHSSLSVCLVELRYFGLRPGILVSCSSSKILRHMCRECVWRSWCLYPVPQGGGMICVYPLRQRACSELEHAWTSGILPRVANPSTIPVSHSNGWCAFLIN